MLGEAKFGGDILFRFSMGSMGRNAKGGGVSPPIGARARRRIKKRKTSSKACQKSFGIYLSHFFAPVNIAVTRGHKCSDLAK